jgi:hypothetical protein
VNIYTYLFPALIIVLRQNNVYGQITRRFPEATSTDRLIFNLNIVAALATALLSSTYHTLMNHSCAISALCLRIDCWHPAIYPEQRHLRDLRWIPLRALPAESLLDHDKVSRHYRRFPSPASEAPKPKMALHAHHGFCSHTSLWLRADRARASSVRLERDVRAVWYAILASRRCGVWNRGSFLYDQDPGAVKSGVV